MTGCSQLNANSGDEVNASGRKQLSSRHGRWDRSTKWSHFRSRRRQRERWLGGVRRDRRIRLRRSTRGEARSTTGSRIWRAAARRGRAGQAFKLDGLGVADETTADSPAADRRGPQQDGQAGKSKLPARSCLRILVQSLRANASPLFKEPATCIAPPPGSAAQGWAGHPGHSRPM